MYYAAGNLLPNADRYCAWFKMNLATSKDLFKWDRFEDNPVFVDSGHARDPFTMKIDGEYYMYYTRTFSEVDRRAVTGLRKSPDLVHWTAGAKAHIREIEDDGGRDSESPYVVEYEGLYYLFVCSTRTGYNNTKVYWSEDPEDFQMDNYVCTLNTHASEIIFDDEEGWFITNTGWDKDGLYIARLSWE